jgi:8-oxo-dGTP pyrophosphatase MutT (NUDIX family)
MINKIKEAVVALIIQDGLILSISRRNDKTKFGLIGGKVDPGETLIEALIRETKEESSVLIKDHVFLYERIEPGGPDGIDFFSRCYYISDWSGVPASLEEGEVTWLTEEELTSTKAAFPEFNKRALEVFKLKFPKILLK